MLKVNNLLLHWLVLVGFNFSTRERPTTSGDPHFSNREGWLPPGLSKKHALGEFYSSIAWFRTSRVDQSLGGRAPQFSVWPMMASFYSRFSLTEHLAIDTSLFSAVDLCWYSLGTPVQASSFILLT